MRTTQKSHALSFIIISLLSFLIIFSANKVISYDPGPSIDGDVATAVVTEIIDINETEIFEGAMSVDITFTCDVTSGEFDGQNIEMLQSVNELFFPSPKEVEVGDQILISFADMTDDGNDDNAEWIFLNHNRISGVILIIAIFIAITIIIGRAKGVYAIFALAISILTIFIVYVPAILAGYNIYSLTIVVTTFVIISSLSILNGLNKKTLCAIVGNFGGIIIAAILAYMVNGLLGITGALDQDYLLLTLLPSEVSIDLQALVWGGVIIGALGAVMDVAMSIASSMFELSNEMKEKTFGKMVHSGMNIGRDAIGTMTNTLILAYAGGALAPLILFIAYNRNFLVLMNFELILVEIISATVGSVGILLAVPVTVFFCAWIFTRHEAKHSGESFED